jgi:hypothetical protein
MTIFSVAGGERNMTVRYIPVVVWGFAALAAYGVGDIVARMLDGRLAVSAGSLGALLLLIAFAGFVLYTGGQVVFAEFDRAADMVRVRRYGLGGRSLDERRLSELAGLEVRVLRRAQHRVELRFKSGERLPLTTYYVVTLNTRGLRRLSRMLGIEPTMAEARRPDGR